MRILVVGGKLQGIEAAYLAKKAGMDVYLVDRNAQPLHWGCAVPFGSWMY